MLRLPPSSTPTDTCAPHTTLCRSAGAQREEGWQFDQRLFGPRREETARAQVTEQRRAEQEGHPDRGEIAVDRGVGVLVEPVRVHHRKGLRKGGRALVA